MYYYLDRYVFRVVARKIKVKFLSFYFIDNEACVSAMDLWVCVLSDGSFGMTSWCIEDRLVGGLIFQAIHGGGRELGMVYRDRLRSPFEGQNELLEMLDALVRIRTCS